MESNCINCKYWLSNSKKTMGKCILSKQHNPMMFSGCGLYTREDFGCKLFKSK